MGAPEKPQLNTKAFISIQDHEHLEVDKSLEESKAGFYTLEEDIV